jgi:hypothetical protein
MSLRYSLNSRQVGLQHLSTNKGEQKIYTPTVSRNKATYTHVEQVYELSITKQQQLTLVLRDSCNVIAIGYGIGG